VVAVPVREVVPLIVMEVLVALNTTLGVLTVVVPRAPAVVEPMFTLVVEPDAPPVPRFRVLEVAVRVAPVPMLTVVAAVAAARVAVVAAEAVNTVLEKVRAPLTVWVWSVSITVPERLGRVKVRVVALEVKSLLHKRRAMLARLERLKHCINPKVRNGQIIH
jgi:hypothetical protein